MIVKIYTDGCCDFEESTEESEDMSFLPERVTISDEMRKAIILSYSRKAIEIIELIKGGPISSKLLLSEIIDEGENFVEDVAENYAKIHLEEIRNRCEEEDQE